MGKFAAIAAIQKDVIGCMQLPSRRPDSKDWRAVYKALRDPTCRAIPFNGMQNLSFKPVLNCDSLPSTSYIPPRVNFG